MNCCTVCEKSFKYPSKLTIHLSLKKGCSKACVVEKEIEKNTTPVEKEIENNTTPVESDDERFVCLQCDKSFKRKYTLSRHKVICNGCGTLQCQKCLKVFKSRNRKSEHKKIGNCISFNEIIRTIKHEGEIEINKIKKENKLLRTENDNFKKSSKFVENNIEMYFNGVIYLLKEREFIMSKTSVYKVGKTTCMSKRMSKYPKGSYLMFSHVCKDIHEAETKILELFDIDFEKRNDLGCEYFEGDMLAMIQVINKVLEDVNFPPKTVDWNLFPI
jgi:hypothetical protein